MKKIYLLLVLFISVVSISAQNANSKMLFDDFTRGVVNQREGGLVEAMLNYDTDEGQMIFKNSEGTVLSLANPDNVIFIVIDKRVFVPVQNGIFYEQINVGDNNSYFIQWKKKIVSEGKATAYGGHSSVAAVNDVSTIHGTGGQVRNLTTSEKAEYKNEVNFYIKPKNSYKKFYSAASLAKNFKGHEAEIQNFAKQENIDFEKMEDISRMVAFCYSLK